MKGLFAIIILIVPFFLRGQILVNWNKNHFEYENEKSFTNDLTGLIGAPPLFVKIFNVTDDNNPLVFCSFGCTKIDKLKSKKIVLFVWLDCFYEEDCTMEDYIIDPFELPHFKLTITSHHRKLNYKMTNVIPYSLDAFEDSNLVTIINKYLLLENNNPSFSDSLGLVFIQYLNSISYINSQGVNIDKVNLQLNSKFAEFAGENRAEYFITISQLAISDKSKSRDIEKFLRKFWNEYSGIPITHKARVL